MAAAPLGRGWEMGASFAVRGVRGVAAWVPLTSTGTTGGEAGPRRARDEAPEPPPRRPSCSSQGLMPPRAAPPRGVAGSRGGAGPSPRNPAVTQVPVTETEATNARGLKEPIGWCRRDYNPPRQHPEQPHPPPAFSGRNPEVAARGVGETGSGPTRVRPPRRPPPARPRARSGEAGSGCRISASRWRRGSRRRRRACSGTPCRPCSP